MWCSAVTNARRADAVALLAILLAGSLSAVWAFVVPIFQAPDEPAHFDYAISIYNAHHLIRVGDGRPAWIASPYTKYLMRATDWERIAWHSSMRAPVGYGSRAYFAKLDSSAPDMRTSIGLDGNVNYIAPYYPFAFYGLEALWMHAPRPKWARLATYFFRGTAAVRLLDDARASILTTARRINLGIPRWTSVARLRLSAFFLLRLSYLPMCSPIILAFLLVSAALLFATELQANDRIDRPSSPLVYRSGCWQLPNTTFLSA